MCSFVLPFFVHMQVRLLARISHYLLVRCLRYSAYRDCIRAVSIKLKESLRMYLSLKLFENLCVKLLIKPKVPNYL